MRRIDLQNHAQRRGLRFGQRPRPNAALPQRRVLTTQCVNPNSRNHVAGIRPPARRQARLRFGCWGRISVQAIMKFLTTWFEVESAVAVMSSLGGKRIAIGGISRGRWCGPHNTSGQGCRYRADRGHQYSRHFRLHVGFLFSGTSSRASHWDRRNATECRDGSRQCVTTYPCARAIARAMVSAFAGIALGP